jgi:3-oxoacyl-[acyl-carrier protein] reductase
MSFFGSPYFPGYGAAKAAVVQLTKTLAAGWAADNIRVNAVAPGSVPTRMTAKYAEDPAIAEMVNAKTPMRRWGTPEEIANAVQFVCSDAATFITGHTLIVDGGYSIID